MSPQQSIFTLCRMVSSRVIPDTYDYLPGEGTKYPFVFIGEQFAQDTRKKNVVIGSVQQTIHVYHNDYRKRGSTTKIMDDILAELRKQKKAGLYSIDLVGVSMRVVPDNTTSTPLLHGIMELNFKFN